MTSSVTLGMRRRWPDTSCSCTKSTYPRAFGIGSTRIGACVPVAFFPLVLAADIGRLGTRFLLSQDRDDLFLAELQSLHLPVLSLGRTLTIEWRGMSGITAPLFSSASRNDQSFHIDVALTISHSFTRPNTFIRSCSMRSLGLTLAGTAFLALPAYALSVSPTTSATELTNTLFLNLPGLQVTGATFSGQVGQAGTYTNQSGTYGLPNSGIILSSGNVNDYADGEDTSGSFSTGYGVPATQEQEDLLGPITGMPNHNDVAQLDVSFNVGANVSQVSFFGAFGSEEFPDYVNSVVDGFGLYVNGVNVAGVRPTGGGANQPVNINHPDMDLSIDGTELNGMLAPNGNPVLRFDVPVNPGQINEFQIILGDASDTILDSTVYLSSFIAQGNPGDSGGPPPTGDGSTEFNPILPSNPPDPETGEFVVELPELEAGENVWIDPPVAVGYVYNAGTAEFATITAPSLATIADLDGYLVTVDGVEVSLAAGATLEFGSVFGSTPTTFTLSGIDPDLALDPADPMAFPLGVSFTTPLTDGSVSMTPTVEISAVPLPATGLLLGFGVAAIGAMRRRRSRRA